MASERSIDTDELLDALIDAPKKRRVISKETPNRKRVRAHPETLSPEKGSPSENLALVSTTEIDDMLKEGVSAGPTAREYRKMFKKPSCKREGTCKVMKRKVS